MGEDPCPVEHWLKPPKIGYFQMVNSGYSLSIVDGDDEFGYSLTSYLNSSHMFTHGAGQPTSLRQLPIHTGDYTKRCTVPSGKPT